MGVVYHTHYLDYFEAARTEALRALGVAYRELEAGGIIMPVVDLAVQYRRPARYDDLLAITARFDEVPSFRVRVGYEVRRVDEDDLLVSGHVSLCFIDTARNRPVPTPPAVRDVFDRAFAD